MPNPLQHADDRGWLESIIRKVPGFKGYLEKSYRRDSDRLLRQGLADRLQRGKQGITDYTRTLADAGQIDHLPACDQMRSRLDKLIARLRGSVSGYSGVFDLVQIDVESLDEVYAHDMGLCGDVDALAEQLEDLRSATKPAAILMPRLLGMIDALEDKIDRREDLLRGLMK